MLAPEPMRFSRTGAGAPHCSCFTGSDDFYVCRDGASSRTHSRKAAITWASDQTSGLGGSACAASGGLGRSPGGSGIFSGSGWRDGGGLVRRGVRRHWLFPSRRPGSPARGCLLLRFGRGSRFTRDLRAASWNVGSADGSSVIGTGLACTNSIGATRRPRMRPSPTPDAAPCGRHGQRRQPQHGGDRELVRHGDDRPGKECERFRSIRHARLGILLVHGAIEEFAAWRPLVVELWCLELCRPLPIWRKTH